MAFSLHSAEEEVDLPLADINVTPLVDVMLVLLIIFMITAPMLHQGIEVALPEAEAEVLPMRVDDPLVISINRDGLVYLQDRPVHQTQLLDTLGAILEAREDEAVFLKGDKEVPYGRVIEVMDLLHQGGIHNIGMVTERTRP